jgi:hypothetical protein
MERLETEIQGLQYLVAHPVDTEGIWNGGMAREFVVGELRRKEEIAEKALEVAWVLWVKWRRARGVW